MLPDRSHLLVTSWGASAPEAIEAVELATGASQSIVPGASLARLIQTTDGTSFLIYAVGTTLYGARFNSTALHLDGDPVLLSTESPFPPDQAFMDGSGDANSMLTYLTGTTGPSFATPIESLDATGNSTPILTSPAEYRTPRYSPDGKLLAYVMDGDLWTHDPRTEVSTQKTFGANVANEVAWTPDSQHLLYGAQNRVWWVRADGSRQPVALLEGEESFRIFSVAPDSRTISVGVNHRGLPDLYLLPFDPANVEKPTVGALTPFAVTSEPEAQGEFSPDGKWIAYSVSGPTGGAEVFVQPFPPNGSKWRVAGAPADFPQWSRDGHLFYVAGDQIMVMDWSAQNGAFITGRPRVWSPTRVQPVGNSLPLALHPDGKHFAVFPKPAEQGHLHAVFVLNPVELIRRGQAAK